MSRRHRAGTAAVEFGLLAPLFFVLLFGMADYGLALDQRLKLQTAARAGAQVAIATPSDTAAIENAVRAALPAAWRTDVVFENPRGWYCECVAGTPVACDSSAALTCATPAAAFVEVNISRPITPITPLGPTNVTALAALRRRCRRGAMTLEFALIAGPLLVAILAVFDWGRYLGTRAAFSNAVAAVTREAVVNTTVRDCPAAETWVLARSALLTATPLTVCVTADAATETLQVRASYDFRFVFAFFATPPQLSANITHPYTPP
jgi:Flp pilus assembly protein TadG